MSIVRVKTGIKGFDELIQGGVPQNSSVLLAGPPGAGKTIFCLEYLYNGAVKFGEKGVFVSFEENGKNLKKQAAMFGWNLEPLIKKGLLEIVYIPSNDIGTDTSQKVIDLIIKGNVKRIVIDSLSTLAINAPLYQSVVDPSILEILSSKSILPMPVAGQLMVKRFIYNFIESLHHADHCTPILTAEANGSRRYISRDTISEFACDGVISIKHLDMAGRMQRFIQVVKMRGTKIDSNAHELEITKKGIGVMKNK